MESTMRFIELAKKTGRGVALSAALIGAASLVAALSNMYLLAQAERAQGAAQLIRAEADRDQRKEHQVRRAQAYAHGARERRARR